MSQQPTAPAKPGNPFSSLPRLGANANNQPPAPAAPTPPQPAPARPNPLASRLEPPKTPWRITSVATQIVRFDLHGLGDPFHRLLGQKLSLDLTDMHAVIQALESRSDDSAEIVKRLDTAWQEYGFKGAMLLFQWRNESRAVLTGRIPSANEAEAEELYDDDKPPAPMILRSLDFGLVLNVLGRTRATLLLPDAPLVLETQYLNRSLYSGDSRLLAIARATGCVEEAALK